MTATTTCPACGRNYRPAESPGGGCPSCLLGLGLEPETRPETESGRHTRAAAPTTGAQRLHLGPYKLLSKLGEGGMGEVYVAEQHDPIRRRVALKVIKRGMDSKAVLARFESERQALALMNHPNIARVFDAGVGDSGQPYFAMELVQGIDIIEFCDRRKYSTAQRLELFVQVCAGVQHAHQKGVIHRDLKPSNILVTESDGRAVPKIIDFGVAKAISQRLTEHTVFTQLGQWIGTPEYMSPEQADLTAEDIDTRSDVYTLGVILYQLLTGCLPFDPAELREAGFDEMRRRIRDADPPRPSTRLSSLGGTSTEIAERRGALPSALISRLRGDLDWITMKALEKDRARRYGTSMELAADVERHLHDEPVVAGPPSATYRLSKFVKRHRLAVFAASVIALLLVASTLIMSLQARRIARERDRANQEAETALQVSDFLQGLFRVADPSQARGNEIRVREILDQGAGRIEEELDGQPVVQARMMETIGNVYRGLGLYEPATELLAKALELRRAESPEGSLELIRAMHLHASVLQDRGHFDEAEQIFRESLAMSRQLFGNEHNTVASALNDLARLLDDRGELEASEELHREALALRRTLYGNDDGRVAGSLTNLGQVLRTQGKLEESEAVSREALEMSRRTQGRDHPNTVAMVNNLANLLREMGRLDEAEQLRREAMELARQLWGERHPRVAANLNNLGTLLRTKGDLVGAEQSYREALELFRETLGDDHPALATVTRNLGVTVHWQGRLDEAEALLLDAADRFRSHFGEPHYELASLLILRGEVAFDRGDAERARSLFEQGLAMTRATVGDSHTDVATALEGLAALRLQQGDVEGAAALLDEALTVLRGTLPEQHWRIADAESALGEIHTRRGDYAAAETMLLAADRRLQAAPDARQAARDRSRKRLAQLYRAWGRPLDAARYADG